MKPYTLQVDINLPRDRVIELFDDPDNLAKWQTGLQSFEHLSGEPGQPGAKSRMIYQNGKHRIELIETVTERNLPDEFNGTYEWSGGSNTLRNRFIELGQTRPKQVRERTTSPQRFNLPGTTSRRFLASHTLCSIKPANPGTNFVSPSRPPCLLGMSLARRRTGVVPARADPTSETRRTRVSWRPTNPVAKPTKAELMTNLPSEDQTPNQDDPTQNKPADQAGEPTSPGESADPSAEAASDDAAPANADKPPRERRPKYFGERGWLIVLAPMLIFLIGVNVIGYLENARAHAELKHQLEATHEAINEFRATQTNAELEADALNIIEFAEEMVSGEDPTPDKLRKVAKEILDPKPVNDSPQRAKLREETEFLIDLTEWYEDGRSEKVLTEAHQHRLKRDPEPPPPSDDEVDQLTQGRHGKWFAHRQELVSVALHHRHHHHRFVDVVRHSRLPESTL